MLTQGIDLLPRRRKTSQPIIELWLDKLFQLSKRSKRSIDQRLHVSFDHSKDVGVFGELSVSVEERTNN